MLAEKLSISLSPEAVAFIEAYRAELQRIRLKEFTKQSWNVWWHKDRGDSHVGCMLELNI